MHILRTYLVSSPLIALYLTQIVGDARNPPTLLAGKNFTGLAVIGTLYFYAHIELKNNMLLIGVIRAPQMQIRTFQTAGALNTTVRL